MKNTRKAVTEAWQRLRQAIDVACIARGEAQWTNGYRAGRQACGAESPSEDERLFQKEITQFKRCGVAEAKAELAISAYRRIVSAAARGRRQ